MIKNFEYLNLFPIPVMVVDADLPHKEIADYAREQLAPTNKYTSYYENEMNAAMCERMPSGRKFKDLVERLGHDFATHNQYQRELNLNLSWWFSVYAEGNDHCLHIHPGAMISGTYYAHSDEDSVPIRFRAPHYTHAMATSLGVLSENAVWHFVKPKTGQILLWPSWLEHQVGKQTAVDKGRERVALSFNLSEKPIKH